MLKCLIPHHISHTSYFTPRENHLSLTPIWCRLVTLRSYVRARSGQPEAAAGSWPRPAPGSGAGSPGPAGLAPRFPGLAAASRQVVNAQAEQNDAQGDLLNDLILGVIVLLAAVTVVNTLVMTAVGRRPSLLLLRRVGATSRQLMSMTACQSVLLTVVGIGLGAGAGAVTLITVSRSLTGGWPQVTPGPALAVFGSVLALTLVASVAGVVCPGETTPL